MCEMIVIVLIFIKSFKGLGAFKIQRQTKSVRIVDVLLTVLNRSVKTQGLHKKPIVFY
jgi:hypothetical protein